MALVIPGFDSTPAQPGGSTPQAAFAGQSGTRSAAGDLRAVYQGMQTALDNEALADARIEFERGVAALNDRYAGDDDYETAGERYQQDLNELKQGISGKLNRRVTNAVAPWMEGRALTATSSFQADVVKRRNSSKRAGFAEQQDFMANRIIYAETDDELNQAAADAELRFESMRPFYESPEAYERDRDSFEDRVIYNRELRRLEATNGQGFEPIMSLSPEKNADLKVFADARRKAYLAEIEAAEVERDNAVEERQEAYELEVLPLIDDGQYGLADWQADTRARKFKPEAARRIYSRLTGEQAGPTDSKRYSMATGLLAKTFAQGSGPNDKFDFGRQRRYERAYEEVGVAYEEGGGAAALGKAREIAELERVMPPGYGGEMTVEALTAELRRVEATSYNNQNLKAAKVKQLEEAIEYLRGRQ